MSSAVPPSSVDAAPQQSSHRFALAFVCTGNISRSPMAVVVRDLIGRAGLEDRIGVVSSGTGSWQGGGSTDLRAIAALGWGETGWGIGRPSSPRFWP